MFLIIDGIPSRRNQDKILRLLLEDKDALIDLTCDYTNCKFLSKIDERFGMKRLELMALRDHKTRTFVCDTVCAYVRRVLNSYQSATTRLFEPRVGVVADRMCCVLCLQMRRLCSSTTISASTSSHAAARAKILGTKPSWRSLFRSTQSSPTSSAAT